jgi:hypothetical protein
LIPSRTANARALSSTFKASFNATKFPGRSSKRKRSRFAAAGEFLAAEIDAKPGGFGIVPESLNRPIVSSHCFLFVADESKLHPRFQVTFKWFGETVALNLLVVPQLFQDSRSRSQLHHA